MFGKVENLLEAGDEQIDRVLVHQLLDFRGKTSQARRRVRT